MDLKNKVKAIAVICSLSIWFINTHELYALQQDTTNTESKIDIRIWTIPISEQSSLVTSDSLLRWSALRSVDAVFKQSSAYRVYSTGTSERQSGLYRLTAEPRHVELYLDGLDLKNPLTGHVDLNRLSIRKLSYIRESTGNGRVRLDAAYREHYLNEPRLYLYFDENGANIRNLDVLYSHNLKKNMNMEIAYHDLRDGLSFYGMNVNSGIIHGRYTWQKSPALRVKSGIQSRIREAEESFGYTDFDLFSFSFNPLIVRPKLREQSRTEMFDGFARVEWDLTEQSRYKNTGNRQRVSYLSSGLNYQTYAYRLKTFPDSTDAGFRQVEVYADYQWKTGRWSGQTGLRSNLAKAQGGSLMGLTASAVPFTETTLRHSSLYADISFSVSDEWMIYSRTTASKRSDDRHSTSVTTGLNWRTSQGFDLDVYASQTRYLPDWQSLYWSSSLYSGNQSLLSEESFMTGLRIRKSIWSWLESEVSVELRESQHTPYIRTSGQFDSADRIRQIAAMVSLEVDRPRIEAAMVAITKSVLDTGMDEYSLWLDAMGSQTMIKGEFFIKGPVYRQAAFTKAGVIARWVPMHERAPTFDPLLNRWQLGLDSRVIPAYAVADLQLATRLRWMMIYLQLENAFNGLGQAGYFETPGYPMSGRRFIFGIHVLFKN